MIQVPSSVRDELIAHARAGLPNEACGLLAGSNGSTSGVEGSVRAERFFPMANADSSPMTFRLDPKEQLQVFDLIDELGMDLVGIVHSHTHTEAYPSPTDRRQAFYPEAHYVLVSLADRNNPVLRAFTIRGGEVHEEEVSIV
jgi:proteasome lid subunit RPN8/RPN11